jgi:LacI family transcriptional regulator
VLNDAPLAKNLTEETRRRVLEAARAFNYRPSYFALNLNKSGSDSVGVLVPEHSEGFFTVVMGGVERYLLSKHFVYFTACHYWKPKLIEEYSQLLINRGAEGLLLLNTDADFESVVPVVTVAAHKEKEGVTNVVIDHMVAARMAIQHLYENGHRKIAYMKGPRLVMDTEFRWEATMEIAREFGVQPTPERIVQMRTNAWSPQVGYEPAGQKVCADHHGEAAVDRAGVEFPCKDFAKKMIRVACRRDPIHMQQLPYRPAWPMSADAGIRFQPRSLTRMTCWLAALGISMVTVRCSPGRSEM